ncbi:MAG: hypothetical protein ACR2PT_11270 [Endozoicomonas sp.]
MDILIWDAGANYAVEHPTDKYRIQLMHEHFQAHERAQYHLVILTGLNHRVAEGAKSSYPFRKSAGGSNLKIDWFASSLTEEKPFHDSVVTLAREVAACDVALLFTRLKKNNYYILVVSFDGYDSDEASASRAEILALLARQTMKIRTNDRSDAAIIILAQHLETGGELTFMNAFGGFSLLEKYHWHDPKERMYHRPFAYNFVPQNNSLANMLIRGRNIDPNTSVQTLSVFLEDCATGVSSYLGRKNITSAEPWYWVNSMKKTLFGHYLGWLCSWQGFLDCETEDQSVIRSGTEFRELSPMNPQYLRLKVSINGI